MEKNNPLYFAIDSDILRELTFIDIIKKSNKTLEEITTTDPLLEKYGGYLQRLYFKMKTGEINLVIVDAVYQESKHSKSLVDFIKEYCYFPDINAINYQEKAEEARKLANAYCKPFIYNEVEEQAPMKFVFIADINKSVPTNDCYIMAQATIEGISLITANGKDFIFNKRNASIEHDRSRGITIINEMNGYYDVNSKGKHIAPKPFHIYTLGPMIKKFDYSDRKLEVSSPQNKLVKADTLDL